MFMFTRFESGFATKEEVVKSIDRDVNMLKRRRDLIMPDKDRLYERMLEKYEAFANKVRKMKFDVELPEGWEYYYSLSGNSVWGAECKEIDEGIEYYEGSFKLLSMYERKLTVADYAYLHETDEDTVMGWIKGRMLRGAKVYDGQWRIPEMEEPVEPNTRYGEGSFLMNDKVTGLPEGMEFINEGSIVSAWRMSDDCICVGVEKCDSEDRFQSKIVSDREWELTLEKLMMSPFTYYMSNGVFRKEDFEEAFGVQLSG